MFSDFTSMVKVWLNGFYHICSQDWSQNGQPMSICYVSNHSKLPQWQPAVMRTLSIRLFVRLFLGSSVRVALSFSFVCCGWRGPSNSRALCMTREWIQRRSPKHNHNLCADGDGERQKWTRVFTKMSQLKFPSLLVTDGIRGGKSAADKGMAREMTFHRKIGQFHNILKFTVCFFLSPQPGTWIRSLYFTSQPPFFPPLPLLSPTFINDTLFFFWCSATFLFKSLCSRSFQEPRVCLLSCQ